MTIQKLFELYVDWLKENYGAVAADARVSQRYYEHVFTTCYNIVPRPPKKDLCDLCESLKIKIQRGKKEGKDVTAIQNTRDMHNSQAERVKDKLKDAEKSCGEEGLASDTRTICVDIQKTLLVPKLNVSSAYYKTKMSLYNLCIYDLNLKQANCFLWDETMAKKGSEEVCSCILKWFHIRRERGDTFTKLRIFADNCYGQNKNIYVILSMLRLIHSQALEKVTIEFMVVGHSYLPCDRAFGSIEKKIQKKNCYQLSK